MNSFFPAFIYFSILSIVIFSLNITTHINADQEIQIFADKLVTEKNEDKIEASGNAVIINSDGTKIKADKIIYDTKQENAIAEGNVILNDLNNNTYFLNEMRTYDSSETIRGTNVGVRFGDGSRLVGTNIFKDENITILDNAEYTPCKEDEYLIKDCPGWKLKSKTIFHDTVNKTVYYDHARLHLFNLPIIYLPHFSHPDPSVNKRTGFLMPTIQTDNNLGEQLTIPYFINIASNKDLTFTPHLQSKANNIYSLNYRQLNNFGLFNLEASIDDNEDNNGTSNHIFFDSEINNKFGDLTIYLKTSNNDTYLRKNKINQLTVHESGIKFMKETSKSRLELSSTAFKHLTIQNSNQWEYSYPSVLFNIKNFKFKDFSGNFSLNNNFSFRKNLDESYKSLASSQINWGNRNINFNSGLIFDNKSFLRIVSISKDKKNGNDEENIRFFPQFSSKISYPLFKPFTNSKQTLTPLIMPIIAPYNNYTNAQTINNSNLFSKNRATSLSESESGPRLNYGIEWFLEHENNFDIKLTAGQSLRFNKNRSDESEEVSDYYISSNIIVDNNKYFNNTLIFDRDNRDIKTNNTNFLLAAEKLSLGVDYDYNSGKYFTASEQLRIASKFEFLENLKFNFNAARNLFTDKNIGYQYGFLYENDCIGVDLNYYRDLTKDRDVKESYGYSFTIVLKPFGTTKQYGKTKVFGPVL